jgi:hypothetical protein
MYTTPLWCSVTYIRKGPPARSKFISEHQVELADGVRASYRRQVGEAADHAQELLVLLGRMRSLEHDMKSLSPYFAQPEADATEQRNRADLANVVAANTRNIRQGYINGVAPGTLRQAFEGLMDMRASLGEAEEVELVS